MDQKILELFHKNKEVAFATAVDGKPHVLVNHSTNACSL